MSCRPVQKDICKVNSTNSEDAFRNRGVTLFQKASLELMKKRACKRTKHILRILGMLAVGKEEESLVTMFTPKLPFLRN